MQETEDLDRYDFLILKSLLKDGRLANKELAEQVGLSPPATWRRLQRLQQNGVIERFTAVLDRTKLGYPLTALAHITLSRHNRSHTHDFEAAVCVEPRILACYAITGEGDYQLHIAVQSMSAYHGFLDGFLFHLPGVQQVKSSFVLKCIKDQVQLPSGGAL